MMTSKAEYLKRYLSNDSVPKKKKKEKNSIVDKSRMRILDDDVDFKALLPENIHNTLDDDIGDDTPAVADFIDERSHDVKELERFRQGKQWKLVTQPSDSANGNHPQSKSSTANYNAGKKSVSSSDGAKSKACRHDSDSDLDIPRHQRHDSDSDVSPARTAAQRGGAQPGKRRGSDSDLSPPRTAARSSERHDLDSDLSPARTTQASGRHHNSDHPPTHSARKRHDSDLSPLRAAARSNKRHDSDSDLSPARTIQRSANSHPTATVSRFLSGKRHDSDSDLSPPRPGNLSTSKTSRNKSQRHDSDGDLSPPRTNNRQQHKSSAGHDKNSSTGRSSADASHRHRNKLSSEGSDPRKRKAGEQDSDGDLSPVRRSQGNPPVPEKVRRTDSSDSDLSPVRASRAEDKDRRTKIKATKTLSGAQAGLQMAADMRKESRELKRREEASFAKISDELLGKNAQTIVRDKATGRRRDLAAETAKQAEEDAAKAVTTAKYDVWNKGLRQKEMHDERVADALHEAEKPVARYSDDADLDARLREREREDDPMLAYIRRKKSKGAVKSKPVYSGPEPPPNRFSIRPGYRWDGVDRSNGFEKLYFTRLSERKAIKDMAYKWSVENM